jgi:hypothetical protein
MQLVILALLLAALVGSLLAYRRWAINASLAECRRIGINTSRVRRELLTGRDQRIKLVYCLRSEVRLPREGQYTWKLLQRPGTYHSELPDGWHLEGLPTPLPSGIANALQAVAQEWNEGLIELEGTPTRLVAFWDELGGASEAQRVHRHLRLVADELARAAMTSNKPLQPTSGGNF